MQQQYFKTMSQGNFSSKKINSSKHPLNNTKNNLNDKNLFCDFEFTDQQASLIKATLPTEFWLIKENTDQLQKAQKEVRDRFDRVKVSLGNFQSNKSKKTVKKIQDRTKHFTQNDSEKFSTKECQKLIQPQKQKKIRKNHHSKKRVSQKLLEKKRIISNQQIEEEGERSQQQFNIIQQKSTKQIKSLNVQKNSKKNQKQKQKQKQKQLEDGKQKNYLSENKELNKDIPFPEKPENNQILQQNFITNQFSSIQVQQPIQKQKIYSSIPFPTLPSGQPRYIPALNDYQSSSIESNHLRFLFGLPFSTPVNQQINKLTEKQKNFCLNIIHKLKSHRSSQPFRLPVDPKVQGVPDYFYVVYNPMDLGTIQRKVLKDKYKDISQFHGDMNLIFQNSYKYNLRSTKYFQAAVQFEDYYQALLKEASDKPQQFSKQCIPKHFKPKLDTGQLDYTEQTPMKKKKKRQWEQDKNQQSFYHVNRTQILENRRNKNKSIIDEHSALYSHSMINQPLNDFNGYIENQNNRSDSYQNNPNSMRQQNQQEIKNTRLKKVQSLQSLQSSKFPNDSDPKYNKKQKGRKQQKNIFAKVQTQLSNLNSKTASIQTFSLPMQPNEQLNKLSNQISLNPINENVLPLNPQIIKQNELNAGKIGKRVFGTKQKLTKQISKGQNNRGKRAYNIAQRDREEDSDEQYKISKNKQRKVEKQVKQVKEKKQKIEQQLKIREQIELQEQNQNIPLLAEQYMNENMNEYMYNQYMSGYNYYYNQMPPSHYNNYMMLNRRINIGSDDDFQQPNMGINMDNDNNDVDMGNMSQDIGAVHVYHDIYPYEQYIPSNSILHVDQTKNTAKLNLQLKTQSVKQEGPKNKKRNIMKFPPKSFCHPIQNLQSNLNLSMKEVQEKVGEQVVGQIIKQDDQEKKQQKQREEVKIKNKQKMIDKLQKIQKKKVQEGHKKITVTVDNLQHFQQIQVKKQNKVQQHLSLPKSKSNMSNRNLKKQKIAEHQQQYIPHYPYYHLGCQNISNHPQNQYQNITINNINQQPPIHPQRLVPNVQSQNIDINMIIQKNTQHQNYSGSTVTSNINSTNKYPYEKGNTIISNTNQALPIASMDMGSLSLNKRKSKIKNKRKNDEQYEYSSDDQYNIEEEWRIIRRNYFKPSKRARPKIHKQKKDSNSQDYLEPKRGKKNKKNKIMSFMKSNQNLSNTSIRQNADNRQPINISFNTNDQQKTTKIQQQIEPKNIFIESEHQSSHLLKHGLDILDYMGVLVNSEEGIKVEVKKGQQDNGFQKQIGAYRLIKGQKEQWLDENEYNDKYEEDQGKEYGFNFQVQNMQKE